MTTVFEKHINELDDKMTRYTLDEYEEILNDCYPEFEIAGQKFPAGKILRKMDSAAFIENYWSFINSLDEEDWA